MFVMFWSSLWRLFLQFVLNFHQLMVHCKDQTMLLIFLEGMVFLNLTGSRELCLLRILKAYWETAMQLYNSYCLTLKQLRESAQDSVSDFIKAEFMKRPQSTGGLTSGGFRLAVVWALRGKKKKKRKVGFLYQKQHFCMMLHWILQLTLYKFSTHSWIQILKCSP